jgi:hypothetical protein
MKNDLHSHLDENFEYGLGCTSQSQQSGSMFATVVGATGGWRGLPARGVSVETTQFPAAWFSGLHHHGAACSLRAKRSAE